MGGPLVVLPDALGTLLAALVSLTTPGMPTIAVIGGMGVNIRLSTVDHAHRATFDIDVVADDVIPTAIEILARDHELAGEQTVVVDGIEVDVIPTSPLTDRDLDGLDDDAALFVAGHRWALETATIVRLTVAGREPASVPVATPAGLVAAKSHAAGYPRPARRATKHGGDLYDIYRLIEVFDAVGALRAELAAAPGGLGRFVADVLAREVLTRPAAAMRQMAASADGGLVVERVTDVVEPFVDALRA